MFNFSFMSLADNSRAFKPFKYLWAYEAYKLQNQIHWAPEEVPMADDIEDWNNKLTVSEKNLLTHIFRFFTQGDIDVASSYINNFLPTFPPAEVRMMLLSFAAMEAVHIDAYSLLIETVGMPSEVYSQFLEYKEMADKHNYMSQFNPSSSRDLALAMAAFGAFTEGLQLFSSFAILMNFPRFNKMKGMGQIVTWSVRDESLHVESMIKLFKTFISENPEIWNKDFRDEIRNICKNIVELEDKFIDLAFEIGPVEGLSSQDIKRYIRFVADGRLVQLGLDPEYYIGKNPLPWMDNILNLHEHANFFEVRATEYSKGTTTGTWEEAFNIHIGK